MKLLLILLLACRAAAVQNVLVQDDVFGDDKVEIDTAGVGGDSPGVVIDGNAVDSIEGESGGNAADVVKGSDGGTEESGGDAKGGVEFGAGCDTGDGGDDAKGNVKCGNADSAAGSDEENAAGVVKEDDVGSAEELPGSKGDAFCHIEDGGDDYFDDDYNYYGGTIKRIKDVEGVHGGLLPANPPPAPTLEFLADRNLGYKIRRQVNEETGQIIATIIKPLGNKEDSIRFYLIQSFERLNLFEVLEVVKYRIQLDPVLATFVSYMESDVFIGQRVQLKKEPSVKEFLGEPTVSFKIPAKIVFYKNLRILIRRLFSSCPPKSIVRCDFDEDTVDTLLSSTPITEVARMLQTSISDKPEWLNSFEGVINHLNLESTVGKLNAIRSSPTYKQMRKYLARKLNLESLDSILNSFYGFDLALIFSVYIMI